MPSKSGTKPGATSLGRRIPGPTLSPVSSSYKIAPSANTLARAVPGAPLRSSGAKQALSRGKSGGFCASASEI